MKERVLLILFGAIIVCFIAFLNKFPLVYSDTGTYIASGFNYFVPYDRPIFYGLFVRHVSLWTSLWLVIFAQGLIVSYVVFITFTMFYAGTRRNFLFLFSLVFLTLFTGLSHNVSILIPDIFSPVAILCFINLLFNNKLSKVQRVILFCIFIFSLLVHFSNLMVMVVLSILILFYMLYKKLKKQTVSIKRNRMIGASVAILSVFIIAPSVNYAFCKQFVLSRGSHVFMINHLLETGILEEYLNDECGKKNYKLCQYKDQLGWDFIWRDDSPLVKMGGWDATKDDYNKIIFDIITTPKYAKDVALQSIEYSLIQYFNFDIFDYTPMVDKSAPLTQVSHCFPEYIRAYDSSRQSGNHFSFSATSEIQRILVLISLAFLICIVFTSALFSRVDTRLKWLVIIILVCSYLNALICSTFSGVDTRFQDRIIWLIPFAAILVAESFTSAYLSEKKITKKE